MSPSIADDRDEYGTVSPQSTLSIDIPTFSLTPHGVLAHLPFVEMSQGRSVALLSCSANHRDGSEETSSRVILGLYLFLKDARTSLARPQYLVGFDEFDSTQSRITCIRRSEVTALRPRWRSVYIVARPDFRSNTIMPPFHFLACLAAGANANETTPGFRFPAGIIRAIQGSQQLYEVRTDAPWRGNTGPPALKLKFRLKVPSGDSRDIDDILVCITLGRCTQKQEPADPPDTVNAASNLNSTSQSEGALTHWAHVRFRSHGQTHDHIDHDWERGSLFAWRPFESYHSCADDHVSRWSQRGRHFERTREVPLPAEWFAPAAGAQKRIASVALAFGVCPLDQSGETLLLHKFRLSCIEELG